MALNMYSTGTNDWNSQEIYKKIVGALLLDFSAAFDIINHNLLRKCMRYGFSPSAISGFSLMEASRM